MADGGDGCQETHVVDTTESMEAQADGERERCEYEAKDNRMSAYDSDDCRDLKCRGDVDGDPNEFNEDGSYNIPEDMRYAMPELDVQRVNAVDL